MLLPWLPTYSNHIEIITATNKHPVVFVSILYDVAVVTFLCLPKKINILTLTL